MATSGAPRERLDFLDGLRGLLALYVVQRHAEVYFWRVTESHSARTLGPWTLLRFGHFAVDVFIVISGFCLFLPVRRAGGVIKHGARAFFTRRAIRILPPYYAAFGASILCLWAVGESRQFTGRHAGTVWHHLLLVHDALSPFAVNSALWSVAVEVHIYLFFPLLVWSVRRAGMAVTFAWATLFAGALYVLLLGTPYRVITPHYLLLFMLGMLAAQIYTSPRWDSLQKLPWGVLAAVTILGTMVFHQLCGPRLVDLLLGVEDVSIGIGAMSLLLVAARPGLVATALSWRPIGFIGTFSYSIYLIHLPILDVLARFILRRVDVPATHGFTKVFAMAALVLVANVVAYLFYLACERPCVRWLSRPGSEISAATRSP